MGAITGMCCREKDMKPQLGKHPEGGKKHEKGGKKLSGETHTTKEASPPNLAAKKRSK